MNFYWIKTHRLIKKLFPKYIWDIPNTANKIYLTFDDGPTPEITEWVLEQLEQYDAKATFFCIGDNIKKHPEIFNKIISKNHAFGNHTFNHLNGWKTSTEDYIGNSIQWSVVSGRPENNKQQTLNNKLFRPPYGKIKNSQAKKLQKLGYKIIMWDVLSADFDTCITKEKCLDNVLKNTKAGSIIVFHDSLKAFPNLDYTLPKALKYFKERGFICDTLNNISTL